MLNGLKIHKKRNRNRRRTAIVSVVLVILLTACCYVDRILHSILMIYAQSNAETIMSDTANQAVYQVLQENGITYQDIVQLTRGENNEVSALEINTVIVNKLKAQMTVAVSKMLAQRERMKIQVPIGNLMQNEFFWGRGPVISFNMDITGTVLSDFKSRFETAGINQTLHQIVVEVSAQAYIVMPLYRKSCNIKTSFIIAQTVIVGKVPDAYTYVFDDDREDIVGDIFDYGAAVG